MQTAQDTKAEATTAPQLTAKDRCDSCGARAYVRFFISGHDSELLLCKHHADKHEEVIFPQALVWLDERDTVLNS